MNLSILDKIITQNGLYEIRKVNKLKGYNYFTGVLEEITDFITITNEEFLILKELGKEKALEKIYKEYPELEI